MVTALIHEDIGVGEQVAGGKFFSGLRVNRSHDIANDSTVPLFGSLHLRFLNRFNSKLTIGRRLWASNT